MRTFYIESYSDTIMDTIANVSPIRINYRLMKTQMYNIFGYKLVWSSVVLNDLSWDECLDLSNACALWMAENT